MTDVRFADIISPWGMENHTLKTHKFIFTSFNPFRSCNKKKKIKLVLKAYACG